MDPSSPCSSGLTSIELPVGQDGSDCRQLVVDSVQSVISQYSDPGGEGLDEY